MDGTHGFGFGVTGTELRTRIAALDICPNCAGTRRQWCLHTRSSVPCTVCAGGALASAARRDYAPVIPLRPAAVAVQAA